MSEQKPSEAIKGRAAARRPQEALANFGHVQPDMADVLWWLDAEHERRAAFERETVGRLDILERSQRDVVTRLPPPVDHSALTGLVGDGVFAHEPSVWLAKLAVRCSERMPDIEERVLAFVPSQPEGHRWRAARWCAPPEQYLKPEWRDDESEVGDTTIYWQPEQVTHWMPMPGEPT